MKIFKLMAIALVAMVALNSCSEDCDHDYIEVDYSKKLAGIWTCIEPENEYAEALVINADGSVTSTGVFDGQLWEKKGSIKIKDNKMTLSFEDGDYLETRFEMVEGVAFALVDDVLDVRYNYHYCANDLAEEVVGMWVCTYSTLIDVDMAINTYKADGEALFTGFVPWNNGYMMSAESTYKVIGDLMIQKMTSDLGESTPQFMTFRLAYTPNGSEYGDILTSTAYMVEGDEVIESSASYLRIKQSLNLTGKTYDYSSAYVSNAKGTDEDFSIMGQTFNIAKMDAGDFDMMLRSVLSCLEFPNANTFKHTFRVNGQDAELVVPITVEGNKVTIEMSAVAPVLRNVDMYMYQDADDSQLHMYMPTSSFVNYFGNLVFTTLLTEGKIDETDAAAVEKVFADMEARIQSINVSFVFKARN